MAVPNFPLMCKKLHFLLKSTRRSLNIVRGLFHGFSSSTIFLRRAPIEQWIETIPTGTAPTQHVEKTDDEINREQLLFNYVNTKRTPNKNQKDRHSTQSNTPDTRSNRKHPHQFQGKGGNVWPQRTNLKQVNSQFFFSFLSFVFFFVWRGLIL